MKNIFITFIVLNSLAFSILAADFREGTVKQTANNMGVEFPRLGAYEETLVKDCLKLADLASSEKDPAPRFLFLGEAYGRLSLRILHSLKHPADLIVNDLSEENLKSFERSLADLRNSDNSVIAGNAKRAIVLPGDSLKIGPALARHLGRENEYGQFDLIVANNFLHFLDGQQILDLSLNSFNQLKPGGAFFLFFQGGLYLPTQQEMKERSKLVGSSVKLQMYKTILAGISQTAKKIMPELLFTGLIKDEWIADKADTIREMFQDKPNGLGKTNIIPWPSIKRIAENCGFEVVHVLFLKPVMELGLGPTFDITSDPSDLVSIGTILAKPIDAAPKVINADDLDQDIVKYCNNSLLLMKQLIDDKKIRFIEEYPWVTEGCFGPNCTKEGTKKCGGCKTAFYCSRECQTKHWNEGHKALCGKKKDSSKN